MATINNVPSQQGALSQEARSREVCKWRTLSLPNREILSAVEDGCTTTTKTYCIHKIYVFYLLYIIHSYRLDNVYRMPHLLVICNYSNNYYKMGSMWIALIMYVFLLLRYSGVSLFPSFSSKRLHSRFYSNFEPFNDLIHPLYGTIEWLYLESFFSLYSVYIVIILMRKIRIIRGTIETVVNH